MAGACFDNAVGVADPSVILNGQMTASSVYTPDNQYGYNGRLNRANQAWCASGCCKSDDWLQIDLVKTFQICGVATQGNGLPTYNEYVTDFKLSYSPDGSGWATYNNVDGSEMVRFQIYFKDVLLVKEVIVYVVVGHFVFVVLNKQGFWQPLVVNLLCRKRLE